MAENNTVSTLNGFYKEVYSDSLKDLVPEGVKLSKMIDFIKPSKQMGLEYHQPVTLRLEHGVTYGGEAGDAFDLETAISGATKDAKVKGCEMVLRGRISIGAISRSINDAASFGRATKHVIKNLMISSYKKQEQMLFYGKAGIASVASVAGQVVTLNAADFAPGIFAGGEGMLVDFFDVAVGGTQQGVTTTGFSISSVDIEARTITVVGDLTGVVANDLVLEYGAMDKECLGLEAMLDGSVASPFSIASASYSLWDGNRAAAGGVLTFKIISKAISKAVSKGLEGKLDAFVNPSTWADLLDEQTANVKDSSYSTKKFEDGSQSIVFHSQNGIIEVHSSTYVKEGLAFVLDLKSLSRVGSQELSFKLPGQSEDFVIKLENSHGIEFRTYCDTALFCDAIGHNILINGIINS